MTEPLPQIRLANYNWTVGHWINPGTREQYDVNAPYQRGSVWTTEQRRAFIKSLYMGIPVGSVTVSKLPYNRKGPTDQFGFRVVDGKQRIETVWAFVDNKFCVPAWWFRPGDLKTEDSRVADWVYWEDLSDRGNRLFEMSIPLPALEFDVSLKFIRWDEMAKRRITRRQTNEEILQAEAELYGLLNGGGTPQTEEDMANARRVADNEVPD